MAGGTPYWTPYNVWVKFGSAPRRTMFRDRTKVYHGFKPEGFPLGLVECDDIIQVRMPKTIAKTSSEPADRVIETDTRPAGSKSKGQAYTRFLKLRRGTGLKFKTQKKPPVRTRAKPLPFYAVVKFTKGNSIPLEIHGLTGVVLGRVRLKNGFWSYTVSVHGLDSTYCLPQSSLKSTGVVLQREVLYEGHIERVQVNDSGEGIRIAPEEANTVEQG